MATLMKTRTPAADAVTLTVDTEQEKKLSKIQDDTDDQDIWEEFRMKARLIVQETCDMYINLDLDFDLGTGYCLE